MGESPQHGFWGTTSEEILKNNFPLHRACRDGDVETLSLTLVEAQHGIYVEDSFYGWTPAHWSAYFGKLGCLMKLMENNTNCDCATLRLHQAPSHLAAFAGNSHCLKWLLHCGSAKDKQDYLGETPVHKAARTGSMECASLLASHGARLYIKNKNGLTPAQLASTCGHMECSQYLENTAVRQEDSMPQGVYQSQPTPTTVTQPSPYDLTAASRIPPCVINYGINGGRLPPPSAATPFGDCKLPSNMAAQNGGSAVFNGQIVGAFHGPGNHGDSNELCDMIAMEQESQEVPPQTHGGQNGFHRPSNGVVNGFMNGDVTLQMDVSANRVPIAGKKRCREEYDEPDHKRMRKNGEQQHMTNGYHSNHSPLPGNQCTAMTTQNNLHLDSFSDRCSELNRNTSFLSHCFNKGQNGLLLASRGLNGSSITGDGGEEMSDTALEHCSTVLLELGYGDMVSEAIWDVDHFHGT